MNYIDQASNEEDLQETLDQYQRSLQKSEQAIDLSSLTRYQVLHMRYRRIFGSGSEVSK